MKEVPREPIKLIILGDGQFAVEVTDLVGDLHSPAYEIVGYARNEEPLRPGATLLGKPVYPVDDLDRLSESCQALCALGTTRRHDFTRTVEEMGFDFATIVHPSARVSRTTTVGAGSIISAGALIGSRTRIGRHVLINRGAMVGHHTRLADHVTISPGVNIAASVEIGRQTFVGMGAIVIQSLKVGEKAVVGARSLVIRDVPPRTKVLGAPARILDRNVDGL